MSEKINRLLLNYAKYAIQNVEHLEKNEHSKARKAYGKVIEIYQKVAEQGKEALELFSELMNHPNDKVRFMAACHCLETEPEKAKTIIKGYATFPGVIGLRARNFIEMVLHEG